MNPISIINLFFITFKFKFCKLWMKWSRDHVLTRCVHDKINVDFTHRFFNNYWVYIDTPNTALQTVQLLNVPSFRPIARVATKVPC
jgi:hypothetical protein